MAWGQSEPSTFVKVLPLVIFLIFLAGAAFVGYYIYLGATQIGESASERMNRKNVVWTKDGLKVGVKSIKQESYVDKTQSWVVKAWNLAKTGDAEGEPGKKKE